MQRPGERFELQSFYIHKKIAKKGTWGPHYPKSPRGSTYLIIFP